MEQGRMGAGRTAVGKFQRGWHLGCTLGLPNWQVKPALFCTVSLAVSVLWVGGFCSAHWVENQWAGKGPDSSDNYLCLKLLSFPCFPCHC